MRLFILRSAASAPRTFLTSQPLSVPSRYPHDRARPNCVSHEMCTSKYIKYTCGCEKEMEFIQCPERQGTNVKCKPIAKVYSKDSTNYCSGHLIARNIPAGNETLENMGLNKEGVE